jgi:hypothetical protein
MFPLAREVNKLRVYELRSGYPPTLILIWVKFVKDFIVVAEIDIANQVDSYGWY